MRELADQFHYELRLFARNPRAVVAGALVPVLLLALRAGNSRGADGVATLAGPVVLGVTLTAYTTHAIGLVTARDTGVLKRWHGTPLPSWCYFGGRIAATTVMALESAALTIAAGVLLLGAPVDVVGAVRLTAVVAAGAVAWAALGTAVTSAIPTTDAAWPMLALTYFPLMLVSGAFGTVGAPAWLRTLADYLPARPLVDAASQALHSGAAVPTQQLLVLAGWAAAGFLLSAATFRWEPPSPRRRPAARAGRPVGGR